MVVAIQLKRDACISWLNDVTEKAILLDAQRRIEPPFYPLNYVDASL